MKNLRQPTGEYLLESALESLHQESKKWLSEVELWKIELIFFQKLLDRYARSFEDIEDKKKIDQYQNFMIYYSGELLDQTRKELRQHERFLASQLISHSARINEAIYRTDHVAMEERMEGIRKQIAEKKKSFFEFLESVI